MIFQKSEWILKEHEALEVKKYSKIFGTHDVVTGLLIDRDIKQKDQALQFLNPSQKDLYDPFLLSDMDKAVDRIIIAIQKKESIWVYGDYDVDGITSISLLVKFFEMMDIKLNYYIPDRESEGYGVGKKGIDNIIAQGGDLIITVDCGITSYDEVCYGKEKGVDFIVTDHHEAQEFLPPAVAVINPKVSPRYPFKMLAGCGVAFKLIQALDSSLNLNRKLEKDYVELLEILAFGTVADIVPLVDENRYFTKTGLAYMQNPKNIGLKALKASAELSDLKPINAGTIGFVLAPRINATGRIGNAKLGVELFLEKNYGKAKAIADQLTQINDERKLIERTIYEEAVAYIEEHIDYYNTKFIVVKGDKWHHGVIGIVASKIAEKYYRPTLILSENDGKVTGSARSVKNVDVFKILSHVKSHFSKFGGHEQAAGLSFESEKYDIIKTEIEEVASKVVDDYLLLRKEKIASLLTPNDITHHLLDQLDKMQPFGMGNPRPQFMVKSLNVEDKYLMGKLKNHFKMTVSDHLRVYDCVLFNNTEINQVIKKNSKVHLVVNLEKNSFRGVETIQFLLKDYRTEVMPLKKQIEKSFEEASYHFVMGLYQQFGEQIEREHLVFNSALLDEAIGQEPLKNRYGIFDKEVLEKLNCMMYQYDNYNHKIYMNRYQVEASNEMSYVMMPFKENDNQIKILRKNDYFGENTEINQIKKIIPTKKDLTHIYKIINSFEGKKYEEIISQSHMKYGKILLCLEIFSQMNLVQYEMTHQLRIKVLEKPKHKIDLEKINLYRFYKKIMEM